MESIDQEFRLLKENYARMAEEEIAALADEAYDLTEIAREALQAEISERGLDLQLKIAPVPAPSPEPCKTLDIDDSELISFGWAMNAEKLKKAKEKLTAVGTACFIGPDNVMEPEDYKGGFADGVNVKIRDVDWQRTLARLAHLERDSGKETQEEPEEEQDSRIVCPHCNSEEIVFEGRDWKDSTDPPPTAKFNWSCSACGYQWKDDGIEQEAPAGQKDDLPESPLH